MRQVVRKSMVVASSLWPGRRVTVRMAARRGRSAARRVTRGAASTWRRARAGEHRVPLAEVLQAYGGSRPHVVPVHHRVLGRLEVNLFSQRIHETLFNSPPKILTY